VKALFDPEWKKNPLWGVLKLRSILSPGPPPEENFRFLRKQPIPSPPRSGTTTFLALQPFRTPPLFLGHWPDLQKIFPGNCSLNRQSVTLKRGLVVTAPLPSPSHLAGIFVSATPPD